ncbi:MAG: ABC transporter ATP-binding protein [Bacteroidetes bacterium]|nr:MAG: ABC transporter ATP-binding protein [Bacteroidota bacterium]
MLNVSHLHKTFGSGQILRDISFSIAEREMLAVLGRSGSGKTTLLKILAGLESQTSGEIVMEGRQIQEVPPQNRGIVYLYQEPLLFPHLDVYENLAFGLRLRNTDKAMLHPQVEEMLSLLGLEGLAARMPGQLSGGQKQRVAFGRALLVKPRMLLLDEPFGNLDSETRRQMQDLLRKTTTAYQISGIFVTHDIREAMVMGDRLAYIHQGDLTCYDSREAFLQDPRTEAARERDFWLSLSTDTPNASPA